ARRVFNLELNPGLEEVAQFGWKEVADCPVRNYDAKRDRFPGFELKRAFLDWRDHSVISLQVPAVEGSVEDADRREAVGEVDARHSFSQRDQISRLALSGIGRSLFQREDVYSQAAILEKINHCLLLLLESVEMRYGGVGSRPPVRCDPSLFSGEVKAGGFGPHVTRLTG